MVSSCIARRSWRADADDSEPGLDNVDAITKTPVRASRAIAALFMCCERNLCILDKSIGQEEAPEFDCCSTSSSSSRLCSKEKVASEPDAPLLLLRRCCFFCCDLRLEAAFGMILGGPRKARRSLEVGMVTIVGFIYV